MRKYYGLLFLGLTAAAGCTEDKYVLDTYSTMRYEALALPTPADTMALKTVDFVSAREGFVGGAGGALFATIDAGQTWTRRSQPALGNINKLLFTSASAGWAGTATGIYRTANGGATWQNTPTGGFSSGGAVYDLQFVTAQVGYAVGTGGAIYKTTNGGSSWTNTQTRPDKRYVFRAVSFTSVDSGTVVGAEHSHWLTTNGGATWSFIDFLGRSNDEPYYDVLRYNAKTYLLATPTGFESHYFSVLHETDRPDEGYDYPVQGLASAGPRGPVVAVGHRTLIRAHAAYSQSEHTPWVYVHAPDGTSLTATYYAADFAEASTFYAVGARGVIHRFHYQ